MNCQRGDLAFVRTTHPMPKLHGLILKCLEYELDLLWGDCWYIEFAGGPQVDDFGVLTRTGLMADRHLTPIRGLGVVDETPHEIPLVTS